MIELIHEGDIFKSQADALVIPVNCVGTMGAGLALTVKKRFPAVYDSYRRLCDEKTIGIGKVESFVHRGRRFVYLPTKNDWRDDSKFEDIHAGLHALSALIIRERIPSVAVPALGCGCGNLSWSLVEPKARAVFSTIPHVKFELYAPHGKYRKRGPRRSTRA